MAEIISEDGSVERYIVVRVLSAMAPELGYSFSEVDSDESKVMMVKEAAPEITILPKLVRRKMLHRFAHKYKIPIEYFYNPEICCGSSAKEK